MGNQRNTRIGMKTITSFLLLSGFFLISGCSQRNQITDHREQVLGLFKNPPAEFRSMPLWVWNNRITEQQIDEQLSDFKEKGIGGVFVHPRPGLITPYLSDEWFSRYEYAIKAGKKLGMQVWIYDENSYPSGFAGGHVPAEMPEAAGKMIRLTITEKPDTFRTDPLKVFLKTDKNFTNVSGKKPGEEGTYYVCTIEQSPPSSWYGGYSYVDLMQKKVTDKFLEITFEKGYNRFSAEYGKTIPGTFMDEPNLRTMGGRVLNYSDILFDTFRKEHGYSLTDSLFMLTDDTGNYKKVRYDYYSTLLELFISGWAEPYQAFCKKNNLILTGHYWDHDWPIPNGVPDNMAMTAYSDYPGIDLLMNSWSPGYGGQFGNALMPREIRSIANQLGKKRTFSETYGAAGWDLTFRDQKRIADWEYALGVNFMNQHISYVTIAGARKRDHPQSFSYHEPWWPQYRVLGDYIGRLSVALSKGEQKNDILVIEPTTTAWMYYSPSWAPQWVNQGGWKKGKTGLLAESFHQFINDLERWQVDYDLGCEDIIRKHGKVENGKFGVGKCSYRLVILPEGLENLDLSTVELLEKFVSQGGKILSACGIPVLMDGLESNRMKILSEKFPQQYTISGGITSEEINGLSKPAIQFENLTSSTRLFHHMRMLKDADLLFLVNSHQDSIVTGSFTAPGKSVEKWDLFTGDVQPLAFSRRGKNVQTSFNLKPGGSMLLCIRNSKSGAATSPETSEGTRLPMLPVTAHRLGLNVLTLDYCSLKTGNRQEGPEYFYQAQTHIFQEYGFTKNPWDNGVQFGSQTLERDTFPANSGFEAVYTFSVADGTGLSTMKAVVERPEYFKVTVNGTPVENIKNEYWLDRDFGLYDISSAVKTGINQLTVSAKPMRILAELEPVYILGNFSLKNEKQGFGITPAKDIGLGSWKTAGMPLFGGKVSYSSAFDAGQKNGKKFIFKPGKWEGVVAELVVNNQPVTTLLDDQEETDITAWIQEGENKVSLIICGSLRNLLGPHHDAKSTGSTWPSMFWRSPKEGQPAGDEYFTLDYGLMEPFEIMLVK
jgi:hypothetical protein